MNHYELLGINREADQTEIKKAYFKKIRQYSPDKFPEEFKKIKEAYDTLQNTGLREKYDKVYAVSPIFRTMYEKAAENRKYNRNQGISICREAIKKGAPQEIFLSLLGGTVSGK